MPNWACGSMALVLPTKNIEKFLRYCGCNTVPDNEDGRCFYRSSFTLDEQYDNPHGLSKLEFSVECAWSAYGCLIKPDCNEDDQVITLEDACHELEVRRLSAEFADDGMAFQEILDYEAEDGVVIYESFERHYAGFIDLDDEEIYEEQSDAGHEEPIAGDDDIMFEDILHGIEMANNVSTTEERG